MGTILNIYCEIERLEQKLTEPAPEAEKKYLEEKLRALYAQLD